MEGDPKAERRQLFEERLKEILPEKSYREHLARLLGELQSDDEALIILKGHLVIEERITAVIEKFVFHPEYLDSARLTFAHKVAIARAMSLDDSDSSVWDLIEKLNSLRNKLSHRLDAEPRAKAMALLKDAFMRETGEKLSEDEEADARVFLGGVLSMCLGFVHSFELEVERFKDYVGRMDRMINPHRHVK